MRPDRINFMDALRWLSSATPGTSLPKLVINPVLPDRIELRCQKRRAKKYPYMIRPDRNSADAYSLNDLRLN